MANSYYLYSSTKMAAQDIQFRTTSTPQLTDLAAGQGAGTVQLPQDLNALMAGETFTAPSSSASAQVWTFLGNVNDPVTGQSTGFLASGPTSGGTTSYALFVPGSAGPLPTSPAQLKVDPTDTANLDRTTGWLIEEAEPSCFVEGTLIATPAGERPVESLVIGDQLRTADGRVVTVRWIGRQRIHPKAGSARPSANRLPIRVATGALGGGLPCRDLLLSADHALVVEGLLVNAGALVNGSTITQMTADALPAQFSYYHVETEAHDEILAEGVPAETFIDYAGRSGFDNFREYLDLYGCERIIPEMTRPRISAARQLPSVLAQRLGIEDFGASVAAEAEALQQRLCAA